jgi:hypothetical protein
MSTVAYLASHTDQLSQSGIANNVKVVKLSQIGRSTVFAQTMIKIAVKWPNLYTNVLEFKDFL